MFLKKIIASNEILKKETFKEKRRLMTFKDKLLSVILLSTVLLACSQQLLAQKDQPPVVATAAPQAVVTSAPVAPAQVPAATTPVPIAPTPVAPAQATPVAPAATTQAPVQAEATFLPTTPQIPEAMPPADPSLIMEPIPTAKATPQAQATRASQVSQEPPKPGIMPLVEPKQESTPTPQPATQQQSVQKEVTQKEAAKTSQDNKKVGDKKTQPETAIKKGTEGTLTDTELDFEVENKTGKTIYVTCFSYIKKRPFSRWRWNKSPIYKIEDDKQVVIDLPTVSDEEDRNNVFGYLGVFENKNDAEESTFQLLKDTQKIDLDIIAQLHNKKVTIEVEKYGIVGEFYDYDFRKIDTETDKVDKKKDASKTPELDFYVENRTGKTIFITCFVYEKKAKGTWLAKKTKGAWTSEEETRDDMSVWRFDKTPVIKIKPNKSELIDVDTIIEPRDRIYVRGYLAIFDEDEKDEAEKSIYELVSEQRKLDLGKLIDLKNKKVIIYTERYGASGNITDYVVKPTQKPDIKKVIDGYFK